MSRETQKQKTRRPRFSRKCPPRVALTDDDIAILRHVAEHRFLRSSHIVRLLQRPRDKILRRLHALFHNGYLDRPLAQRDSFALAGSAPLVYALGSKGALAEEPTGIDWGDKNRSISRSYIEHELLVADFMVALECALRDCPGIRLLRADDIAQAIRTETGMIARPWTMTASVAGTGIEIAVKPDKVFAFEYRDTGRRNYFLLEADRATMPVTRPSLDQSSFKKKLLAYHHGHAAKQHTTLWGIAGFRVLTITKSAARIEGMVAVLKEITGGKGSNVFLFAEVGTVLEGDPLTAIWRSGKGGEIRLVQPGVVNTTTH